MRFRASPPYMDRRTKAAHVWKTYGSILVGEILDVGADECHLRDHLGPGTGYLGIGRGGTVDQEVDLEHGHLPFPDDAFDCVLCLDVLEHLEQVHAIFDECCRVARRNFVLSLPNPLATVYGHLRFSLYRDQHFTKFYGLPSDPPSDRHRWFFSYTEAEAFVRDRAARNGMDVAQIGPEFVQPETSLLRRLGRRLLFSQAVDHLDLDAGPLWAVLQKSSNG